jgi:hypothetical protein
VLVVAGIGCPSAAPPPPHSEPPPAARGDGLRAFDAGVPSTEDDAGAVDPLAAIALPAECVGDDIDLDKLIEIKSAGLVAIDGGYEPDIGGPCRWRGPEEAFGKADASEQLALSVEPSDAQVRAGGRIDLRFVITNRGPTPATVALRGCDNEPLFSFAVFDRDGAQADVISEGGCSGDGACIMWRVAVRLPPGGRAFAMAPFKATRRRLRLASCTEDPAGALPPGDYKLSIWSPLVVDQGSAARVDVPLRVVTR